MFIFSLCFVVLFLGFVAFVSKNEIPKPQADVVSKAADTSPKAYAGVGYARGGVHVAFVRKGSPADKSGLLPGDVILYIQDIKIKNGEHFQEVLSGFSSGDKITLGVFRFSQEDNAIYDNEDNTKTRAGSIERFELELGVFPQELL